MGRFMKFSGIGVVTLLAWAGLIWAGPAHAVTLTTLKDQGLDHIFGRYAPGGDCARLPRVDIDDAGFTFRVQGRTAQSRRFEYAISFMGQSYQGISAVFFPFPVNDGNFGPVILIVNADETPGRLTLETDLPKGQRPDPLHAVLAAASPLKRCGG